MNGCKITIKFECDFYKQTKCTYFEKDPNCPSTKCKSGLFERKCSNEKAKQECLKNTIQKQGEKK